MSWEGESRSVRTVVTELADVVQLHSIAMKIKHKHINEMRISGKFTKNKRKQSIECFEL